MLAEDADSIIEKAEPGDVEEIARLFKRSRRAKLPYLPELHSEAEDIAFFGEHVLPSCQVRVLRQSGTSKMLGFIAFDANMVHHLYLEPDCTGRGLGARLLELAKADSERLDLYCFQANENAISFYRKHGFREIERGDGRDNEEGVPDLLMRWRRPVQV
ncbi:MAG: GNAT family N-acetyltransferase [Cyanobacteria bacterium HKST-UBA02]|nr:GNAT family N-acetyltransferase [Cyanobacteria bacterium HKST-UBA02]